MQKPRDIWDEQHRWLMRAARHIVAAMAREWDPGLRTELDTCIAQWRFGDAMVIADELDARKRQGCTGSITDAKGRARLTDEWIDERAAEVVRRWREIMPVRPERADRDTRMARLGLRG